MMECFAGRRRKMAVMFLIVACSLTAGWIRSRTQLDQFLVSSRKATTGNFLYFTRDDLLSVRGCLIWKTSRQQSDAEDESMIDLMDEVRYVPFWRASKYLPHVERSVFNHDCDIMKWRWRCCGFGVAEYDGGPDRVVRMTSVPYWAIVLPPTLVSAWLLLVRRWPAAIKAPLEPTTTATL